MSEHRNTIQKGVKAEVANNVKIQKHIASQLPSTSLRNVTSQRHDKGNHLFK